MRMPFAQRLQMNWQLRTRSLPVGSRTLILGIVNLTPDSFSGDGLLPSEIPLNETRAGAQGIHLLGERSRGALPREAGRAVAYALSLLDAGADLLDIGAESTRPNSGAGSDHAISPAEEQDRLLPVLEAVLRERPDAVLSVDTYRAATAQAALAAGAEIINDVSGFLWDPAMADVCAAARCGVILMHTRGKPDDWRSLPALPPRTVVPLVLDGLSSRLAAAQAAGVEENRIALDPGYGFGKAWEANYALLRGQHDLLPLGRPLLAGVSRKSFLGRTLERRFELPAVSPAQRDTATLAASVTAILNGASLLRVHTVQPALEAAAIADAVLDDKRPLPQD